MLRSGRTTCRAVAAVIGTGAMAAATLFCGASLAFAQPTPAPPPPPPGCTAGDLAQVSAGVASATADYLFSHPDVNAFFTSLRGPPRGEFRGAKQNCMKGNPRVYSELTGARQPLTDLRARCEPVA